ncbi:rhodanese domain-containing protein [Amylocarpus encephaloides]|uniref:Rhodanese domain-containing protein n=1 Tax=Amylocarpus encephaloides TaxID=45428 RepID=A0A9P7YCZ8_9HELO|nr:rhodanese domain-containing protein [Amylocarpus encephaloides]
MSAPRLAASLLRHAPRVLTSGSRATFQTRRLLPQASARISSPVFQKPQFRCFSDGTRATKTYTFEDVKALSENPTSDTTLIDTREPGEIQSTGSIPGSINIPIVSQPDSFFIPEDEFEDRFGFEKPGKEQQLVVYCKAGVRSRTAAEFARQAGFSNVVEYPGSWMDWEKNGGTKQGGMQ